MAVLSGISFITNPERVFGANTIAFCIALCGIHGRGQNHVEAYSKIKNAELVAICDPDANVLPKAYENMAKRGIDIKSLPVHQDMRKALEDKNIDAISIASPNHWHSLQAIWALQAGKDVYCEKPCSHNWWEVQATRRRVQEIQQAGDRPRQPVALRGSHQRSRAEDE